MATRFNTQTGNGEYRLQFETDSKECYLLMQATARRCVDGKPQTHADQIRAMSDEELASLLNVAGCPCPEKDCRPTCEVCISEWLKQPVEK